MIFDFFVMLLVVDFQTINCKTLDFNGFCSVNKNNRQQQQPTTAEERSGKRSERSRVGTEMQAPNLQSHLGRIST
jgi:hypothetical protein